MPPLQESYQVRTTEEFEVMQAEYKELAAALAGYTDVLLCETMSSRAEGLAATTAAASTGCPWWVSFTVQDNKKGLLRSGERLGDAIIEVGRVVGIEAALVNCCTPNSVLAALPILAQNVPQGVRYGGYANGFRQSTSEWRGEGGSDDPEQLEEGREAAEDYDNGKDGIITPSAYARYARLWLQEGATIVGGCCGIGPAHIACVSQF
jgi:homocysteine S-methyltransferase